MRTRISLNCASTASNAAIPSGSNCLPSARASFTSSTSRALMAWRTAVALAKSDTDVYAPGGCTARTVSSSAILLFDGTTEEQDGRSVGLEYRLQPIEHVLQQPGQIAKRHQGQMRHVIGGTQTDPVHA